MASAPPPHALGARVVEAAIHLLETKGPDAVTLRAVAAAVGVSHMAPYRHFASKDLLLAAVAERGFDELSDGMERAAGDVAPALARLRAFGHGYVGFALRRPALYRLMFGAKAVDHDRPAGLTRAGARAYGFCADTVAAVLERGGPVDPERHRALTVATWSLVHGLALLLIDAQVVPDPGLDGREELIDRVLGAFGAVFR
ncbi:MAG: TetR/AcrR family transcriptional regulator [Trueperaceae bacterium]